MTIECTFTPIRDGYSVIPSYPIREALFEGGATRKYTNALYAPHEVTVNWKLVSPAQYTNFMGFFRTTLKEATEYFLMDMVTDIGALVPHRCRTKGGMPKLNQVIGSCFYVSATLEVEVNPTYTGLILYQEPNIIFFSHTSPRLVGPLQPGDTIQVFNSTGAHPFGPTDLNLDGTYEIDTVEGNNQIELVSPEAVNADWTTLASLTGLTNWIFDGIDDYIDLGNEPLLSPTATTPFTACVWFTTSSSGAMHLFGKQDGVVLVATGWSMFIQAGGTMFLGLRNDFTHKIEIQSDDLYNDGNEHFAVFRHDGSGTAAGLSLRVDGSPATVNVIADTLAGASTSTTAPATIGRRNGTILPFDGVIHDVSYWDTELSDSEADEVYNDGSPPNLQSTSMAANLVVWYKIDENDTTGSGGIADHGPNDVDGTANFSPDITGQYGPELLGSVISTLTRIPS
jgi:hypothetical protein